MSSQGAAAKVLYAVLVISLMLVWFNQNSIRLYCQQKYHEGCEIPGLAQNPEWRWGAQLNQTLEDGRQRLVSQFTGQDGLGLVAQAEASEDEPLAPLPTLAPTPVEPVVLAPAAPAAHPASHPVAVQPPVHEPVQPPVHEPAVVAAVEPSTQASPTPGDSAPVTPLMASLALGDEVFFVGDSLMQGVAPHMANTLRKRYNVKSVNLSRQSTGLAYPNFFN